MTTLEQRFDLEMNEIYKEAKSKGYTAAYFFQMLHQHGGLYTAKYLINTNEPSPGYFRLYDMGRLDLTVEARVLNNSEWHSLFTSGELEKCRKRLNDFGYKPKQ